MCHMVHCPLPLHVGICAPLKLSIPVVIVSAFFLLRIRQKIHKIKSDAAIAALSASALAIGVSR